VVVHKDQEVDGQEDPIVYDQSPARRNTIAGCFDPTAGPSQVALGAVRPLVRAGLPEVVPDHKIAVVDSRVEDSPGPVEGNAGSEEDSLDPEVGIVAAGEDDRRLVVCLGCRMNLKLHDHPEAHYWEHHGTSPCVHPFGCLVPYQLQIRSPE
jgi:hypothetical protein